MKRIAFLSIIFLFPVMMIAQTAEECFEKGKKSYESKDYAEAYKWAKKSADQGNAKGQNLLAVMYKNGFGVTKNLTEAVILYQKAAEQGFDKAQKNLGDLYYNGEGVAKVYAEAVKWYRKAAEQGLPTAQNSLGYMYVKGYGVDQNYSEAAEWYRKSAEQGYAVAQNNLGDLYLNGNGVAKDYNEALKWYKKSAEQKNAVGQSNVGYMYEVGYGVDKDYAEALRWYKKAAEQNNSWAQDKMGYFYLNGIGVETNYDEAVKWVSKAEEQGNSNAKNRLGWMYEKGKGVAKDLSMAVKLYREAADLGNTTAQANLGLMYENGIGVPQDYAEALRWYRKAADQENPRGQAALGYMYEKGKGVAQDYTEAAKWYRKSAEQGNATGQFSLGDLYENGWGVTQDYTEAVKWYRKSAEQGYATGQYGLGHMYANGRGVPQDYEEAIKWLRKSADQGNDRGLNALGYMYEHGYGVTKDVAEAVRLYLAAAEKGNKTAQSNMGVMYVNGIGVEQDYKEAIKWFRKSAENGGSNGMSDLGWMYEKGKGVRKDYTIAMEWYKKAAAQGNISGMRRIGVLYEYGYGVPQNFLLAEEWYKMAVDKAHQDSEDYSDAQIALARIQQKIANEPAGSDALIVKEELVKVHPNVETQQQITEVQQVTPPTTSATKVAQKLPIIDYVDNSLTFVDPSGSNIIKTNGNYKIKFQIQNSGSGEAKGCQVKVSAKGDIKDIRFKDIALNDILPKETMTVEIPINSGTNISNGQVEFTVQVDEPNGFGTDPQFISVTTRGFEAPLVKIADYSLTGSNGKMLKKKQPFDLQLMVQNTKYGQADNVSVNVELPQNVIQIEGDELSKSFAKLAGGESKSLVYSLIVNNNYSGTIIPIKIHLKEKYGKYAEDKTISLNLEQDFAKSKLTVIENKQVRPALEKLNEGSDVDKDIPQTKERLENTFAVIVTNEDYKMVDPVLYARNDGESFIAYCKETLGIPEDHFIVRQDATSGDILTAINNIKDISAAFYGNINVLFYYAGHGIPNDLGSDSYLLPVDGDSRTTEVCYPVSKLYQELGEMNAKRVLVFMDACFSGSKRGNGSLNKARGVAIKAKVGVPKGNMVVFSAATGDQTAYPYDEQEHGLFTYFLLKKLKESGGNCTLGELGQYIQEKVSQKAIVVNRKPQTPTVTSSEALINIWQQMSLKCN